MLRFASWLYSKIADIRNSLYDRGIIKSHSLGAKTISIGNITTGGTGKTPLVSYVADILADAGEKVCILTRGYGRDDPRRRVLVSDGEKVLADARSGGDEPVELARKLLGKAIVIVDADRVSAAEWARERFGVTAFVLDDAFQHRRAKRDLDIVCIDATDPCGGGRVLPAGRLREPFTNIARASAIVLTRSELVESIESVAARVRNRNQDVPIFRADTRLQDPKTLDEFTRGGDRVEHLETFRQTFAFCGLGNPQSFIKALEQKGMTRSKTFPDHHRYTQADIQQLEEDARAHDCNALITTAKDAVKLDGLKFEMPCLVAEIEVVINDADAFRDLVLSA